MKKMLIALILSTICLSSATSLAAKKEIGINLNSYMLQLDVEPTIKDGRILIPARHLLEALGLEVEWQSKTNSVLAKNLSHEIILKLGSQNGHKYNKVDFSSDVAPIVVKNRTLVPVRLLSELVGLDVEWDGENSEVIINSNTEKPNVSLVDAHKTLEKYAKSSKTQTFTYMPFNTHASLWSTIRDTTYIFGVAGTPTVNYNYCVNKHTGHIYEFHPTDQYGDFFWSELNPLNQ